MTDPERRLIPTGSQTVGPFFHFALAVGNAAVADVAAPGSAGETIALRVRVLDGDGAPVPDALIELYQADGDGRYPAPETPAAPFKGFGRLPTDSDGVCVFRTVKPGRVPDGNGGAQAPHINVCLLGRGLLRHLFTRIYFADDAALDEDPVLRAVPLDRRATLLAARSPQDSSLWTFDVRLQGDSETVFFDL
jgi:protocatechuate 3,4-dioxygenase alpha subunit